MMRRFRALFLHAQSLQPTRSPFPVNGRVGARQSNDGVPPPLQGEGWGGDGVNLGEGYLPRRTSLPHPPPDRPIANVAGATFPLEGGGDYTAGIHAPALPNHPVKGGSHFYARKCLAAFAGAALLLGCSGALAESGQAESIDAGAYLDQALTQCLQGNRVQAEETFAYIEDHFSPPAGIRQLIELIRSENCDPPNAYAAWLPDFIAAQAGHTSNANQAPNIESLQVSPGGSLLTLVLAPSMRQQPDSFVGVEGSKSLQFGDTRLSLYGSLRRFDTARDFDQFFVNASATHRWNLGTYGIEAGFAGSAMELGRQNYYRSSSLSGVVRRNEILLEALLMHSRYPVNPAFDANIWQLRAGWEPELANGWRLHARLGLLVDRAESTRPGGSRRGHTAALSVDLPLAHKNALELALRLENTLSDRPYFSGLFDMRREQRFVQASATWNRPLNATSSLEFSARAVRSNDSVPILAYRQFVGLVSWVRSLR